jgi:hypothetical protein
MKKATIILSGMIAADPWQGGATWAVLQYLLGLLDLGHDVCFIEPIAAKAVQPDPNDFPGSENVAYFDEVMRQFGLEGRAALLLAGTKATAGLGYERLVGVAKRADLLINISGMLQDERLLGPIARRVYLDLDPAFNQLWQAAQGIEMRFGAHTHLVTVGQAIGQPECPIPTCGCQWIPTFQPIVLERWPVAGPVHYDGLTTIANWRGYGSITHDGVLYGQKAHSLRPLLGLPRLTREKIMLALAIHPDETQDLAALEANGWTLLEPGVVAHTPQAYQQFVQGSKAELGIAKSGYVASRCGWFSDRSVCYLASGRPVIAQETGFSRYLPTGEGLFSFTNTDDILAGIDTLNRDYQKHSRKARELAREHFESRQVLTRLLRSVGL